MKLFEDQNTVLQQGSNKFYARKLPEEDSNFISWSVTQINSVLKKNKSYYLQVFLKEVKYIEKEKKMIRYIIYDIQFSSDDFDKVFNNCI